MCVSDDDHAMCDQIKIFFVTIDDQHITMRNDRSSRDVCECHAMIVTHENFLFHRSMTMHASSDDHAMCEHTNIL